MDISQIKQNIIKGIEQKGIDKLVSLSQTLNIALGKVVIASVTDITAVTPQERQELLKQTFAALLHISSLTSNTLQLTTALKGDITRLLEQQAIINSPDLKWVDMLINNRPLITYSNKVFSLGQTISVHLTDPQKLTLVDFPDITSGSIEKPASITTQSTNPNTSTSVNYTKLSTPQLLTELQKTIDELTSKIASSQSAPTTEKNIPVAPIANPIKSATTTTPELTNTNATRLAPSTPYLARHENSNATNTYPKNSLISESNQTVANTLRLLLPHKDTPAILYSALIKWQKLPNQIQQILVSPDVEKALKSVAEKIRSPLQLSQPKTIEKIIKHSGVFFEKNLNSILMGKNINSNNRNNMPTTHIHAALSGIYSQDLKGSLLNLIGKVTQDLNTNKIPLTTAQTIELLEKVPSYIPSIGNGIESTIDIENKNKKNSSNLIFLLEQYSNKTIKELSNQEIRIQLLTLLQQHSLHSLSKIQLQQLANLNHEVDRNDATQSNLSWQLDIPIKHQNDIHQLNLHLEHQWVNENKTNSNDNKNKKIKKWSVTLRFDLPTLGEFCAQLAIIDLNVSATLWAAKETTLTKVKEKTDELRKRLENEGIHVTQLQCLKGMPSEKPIALSYSLIDIST